MSSNRSVLLLRRLSTGDSRLKNLNWNQNSAADLVANHVNREKGSTKRLLSPNIPVSRRFTRSFSDNIIKMSSETQVSGPSEKPKFTNTLINEKSPYLLQHAHNPVNWYPWGEEAFEKAKQENKLIFLSVGYSTCHWCHVMEKESFENEEIAKIMNERYINVKVDREERPDIDRIYMLFILSTSGHGGWPMSVFLTPDLHPVTGGTYFPPEDKYGRPGFKTFLVALDQKWKNNREQFMSTGSKTLEVLGNIAQVKGDGSIPGEAAWKKCFHHYMRAFEPDFGGFGTAPKFPQASIINFLFHFYARDKTNPDGKMALDMCLHTLTKIAQGGIHDHVSGGFSRYSVDNEWHVPHFEKMLYDQAQLTIAYTDAFLASKNEFFANVARDIIIYVNRDLRHESGGYYSAEDADSYPTHGDKEKKEGAFYVWSYEELQILDAKTIREVSYFDVFCDYFGIEEDGNISPQSDPHGELKGKNLLIIYDEDKARVAKKYGMSVEEFDKVIRECLDTLHVERQKRPRPHLDTKMICSWNGLMIAGLAQAGQGLGEKTFVEDAIQTANFVKTYLYDEGTKTLLHSCYRSDEGSISQIEKPIPGFLDDYAFLIKGLLDLYEASLELRWLSWARDLQDRQNDLFWDEEAGGYYNCSSEDKTVILRLKPDQDGAEPSGNSVSCQNLLRMAAYEDKGADRDGERSRSLAERSLRAFAERLLAAPHALPEMQSALMFLCDSPTQVFIAGGCSDPRTLELVRAVRSRLLPARVLAVADPTDLSGMSELLLSRIRPIGDRPAAYVCRRYACSLPVTDVKQLESLLDEPPAAAAGHPSA